MKGKAASEERFFLRVKGYKMKGEVAKLQAARAFARRRKVWIKREGIILGVKVEIKKKQCLA